MTAVSVIIPTKNRPRFVMDAVQSVLDGDYQDFDLWVIDQSEGADTEQALAPFRSEARFHYRRNPVQAGGAAHSRNLGIALSAGDILAMTDDDVTVKPEWLTRIAAEFAADADLQFICGRLTAPPYDWREGLTPAFDAAPGLSGPEMATTAAGANFSMRRALLERVGGYDEIWGPQSRLGFSDDGDLSWRIVRSGAKWRICPHIEVVHTHGFRRAPEGEALMRQYQLGLGANFGRFVRRGDAAALLYFSAWLAGDVARGLASRLRGRGGGGLGWAYQRAVGFARAFTLPPRQGFVSGPQLAQRHHEFLTPPASESRSHATVTVP